MLVGRAKKRLSYNGPSLGFEGEADLGVVVDDAAHLTERVPTEQARQEGDDLGFLAQRSLSPVADRTRRRRQLVQRRIQRIQIVQTAGSPGADVELPDGGGAQVEAIGSFITHVHVRSPLRGREIERRAPLDMASRFRGTVRAMR